MSRTMSTISATSCINQEPFAPGTLLKGDSGRVYEIEEILYYVFIVHGISGLIHTQWKTVLT